MKKTKIRLFIICAVAVLMCGAFMGVLATADGAENGLFCASVKGAVQGTAQDAVSDTLPDTAQGTEQGALPDFEQETGDEPIIIYEQVIEVFASPQTYATARAKAVDQGMVDYMAQGCAAGLTDIPLYSKGYRITKNELYNTIRYMIYDYPELFYLENRYSYSYYGDYVYSYLPLYKYTGDARAAAVSEFNALLDAIMAHAPRFATDFEALLYYHDYIVANFEYDTSYQIYDAYTMLKQKKGVCQAYTLLYASILDRLGIENTAAISEDMNHVWNVVSLDGEWYFADLTWDDPIYDVKGRVCHYYFLCSEDFPSHHGWVFVDGEEKQFSDTYDEAFFKSIDCPMHVWDGGIYYLDPTNSYVMRIDTRTKEFTALFYVDTNAYIHGSGGAGYYGSFSGFCGYGNKLYYSEQNRLAATASIYEYNIETKQTTVLYTMQCEIGTAQSVYGLFSCSNTIYYLVADSPNDRTTGTLYSFEVERWDNTQPTIMDVNGDGEITNIDLVMLVRFLSGWEIEEFVHTNADVNCDDKINNRDAIALVAHLAA